jgi:hypothetical protein
MKESVTHFLINLMIDPDWMEGWGDNYGTDAIPCFSTFYIVPSSTLENLTNQFPTALQQSLGQTGTIVSNYLELNLIITTAFPTSRWSLGLICFVEKIFSFSNFV